MKIGAGLHFLPYQLENSTIFTIFNKDYLVNLLEIKLWDHRKDKNVTSTFFKTLVNRYARKRICHDLQTDHLNMGLASPYGASWSETVTLGTDFSTYMYVYRELM